MSVEPFNIYREQLSSLYQGLALWHPDPVENLHHRPGHVSIGDVGYLDNGAFMRMFNVTLPWDDPSNELLEKPEIYERIEPSYFDKVRDYKIHEEEYCTPYVSQVDNVGANRHEDLLGQMYLCRAQRRGALLSLPHKGHHNDVIRIEAFKDYIRDNVDNWFRWSKEMKLPVEHMEDLILVTGCTLVTSWAAAVFDGHISVNEDPTVISLETRKSHVGRDQFFWRNIRGNVRHKNSSFDPDVQGPLPQNQCVFIRGFRAKRVLFRGIRMRAAAEPLPDDPDNRREDEIQVTRIPDSSKYRDPLVGILDYIVQKCNEDISAAEDIIAIVHDDDLRLIEGVESLTANAIEEFLHGKQMPLFVENGAAILHHPTGGDTHGYSYLAKKYLKRSHGKPEVPAALTRLHLEGASDPFPSEAIPVTASKPQSISAFGTDSQKAFPPLAPSPVFVNKPVASAWGTPRPRLAAHTPQVTESFTLSAIDLSSVGRGGKPTTLDEIMKQVMANHKIKIEASTNQKTRQTTFHLMAESRKELEMGKRSLLASLSPVVSIVVDAPTSTIAAIIGAKGATLKQIRDQTSVQIDIPRRESVSGGNDVAKGGSPHTLGATSLVLADDNDEPTVPITVIGPELLAFEARDLIKQIIASTRARATQRVRDIPSHIVPFVKASYSTFVEAAEGGDVEVLLKSAEREVTVSGDREAVVRVIEAIKSNIATISASLTSVKISLPKRQHRFLVGDAVNEILASGKCAVTVPPPEESTEEIVIWGKVEDLGNGVTAVMSRANSQYIHEFPLPGPIALSRQLLMYVHYTGYARTLAAAHPGVSVFIPELAARSEASVLNVDLVGEKSLVDVAVRQVSELMGKLNGATKDVSVDWLVHKAIQGKHAKRIRQLHESHNVLLFFPPESEEQSSVLLVYDPTSPSASPSPVEKSKNVEEVEKELLKWAKDAAGVKSHVIAVGKKWLSAVIGKGEGDVSEGSTKYHAKTAAPHSSEGEVTKLERQLSELLALKTERDQRIARLTDELALKSALLEQAEANAAEAVERRDAELVDMQAQLNELAACHDQEVGQYKEEFIDMRTELKAKESELEAVRLRLTDAEKALTKGKSEADTLRVQTAASLMDIDEDRVTRRLMERMRAIEAEVASKRWNIEEMEYHSEG